MKRRSTYLIVLISGILISLISCKKTIDKAQYEEYVYLNHTSHLLTIKVYNRKNDGFLEQTYNIALNQLLKQEIELMAGSITGIIPLSDSVIVIFGNERISRFTHFSSSPFNIMNLNNYVREKKGSNRNSYTYTFTQEDFINAVEP
ncbi:MAG TPA: hypothetical protein PKE03_05985 [Bacteroidales bacterium]|nr:hypothetical protein [Bacteroidales bacterium]